MFKDDPEILKGIEDLWTIETAVCKACKKEWYNAKAKWKARIKKAQREALEIAAEKKYLSEIKTCVCEFCKEEFMKHKKSRAKFCSPFCRKANRKFRIPERRKQYE